MEYFDVKDVYFWVKVAQIIITAVSVVFSIIMAIKKRKIKFCDMADNIFSWIEEAETHSGYSGDEKLEFVLNKAFKYCINNHISYNEEHISDEIERIIALSKSVNNEYHAPEAKKLNPAITGENIQGE